MARRWAERLACGGLLVLAGCDALDPVETTDLCAAGSGVVSRNCRVCQVPPYAATCPQCQGTEVDPKCSRARGAAVDAAHGDAGDAASLDASGVSDAGAKQDASSTSSADAGDAGDAGMDAGDTMDAGADAASLDAGADAATVCGVCSGTADVCDLDAMVCVECLSDADCDGDDICSEIDTCVQCTGTRYDNCDKATDDTPYVCNSEQYTCTKKKRHSAGDCAPCVSDAHCLDGQICAPQSYGNPPEFVGNFCFWKRSAAPGASCDSVIPNIKSVLGVVSLDGVIAEVCTPRVASCPAMNDVGKGCESGTAPGTADHALCGFTHSQEDYVDHEDQDGFCVDTDLSGGTNWKCTVSCVDDNDCKGMFTCDLLPTPDLCTL